MGKQYERSFRVDLLTPGGSAGRMEAVSVILPTLDGDYGVLGGRAPLIAMVGVGRLRAEMRDEGVEEYFIAGGFAHVLADQMTVLAEECQPIAEIDSEQAWEQLSDARKMETETPAQRAARQREIEIARVKFNLAQEFRRARRQAVEAFNE